MKKIKDFVVSNKWIITLLVIIAGLFYWYEWRPAQIKKECGATIIKMSSNGKTMSSESRDDFFDTCVSVGGTKNVIQIRDEGR